ncbi:hypothetical protein PT974_01403 [Cladobotryum mycophilum]|uniref:Uncharacterized protein n=1 Tax=Cladobotryum mycophilum TaxID=491253 RepID=A0ABR0T4I6_9HYPO
MDGSYGHPARHAQSPMSPHTSSTNSNYQVNVRRNKTRKWVEAKVQNYDGDDWGADEFEEESGSEPESAPPPPPPQPLSTQRAQLGTGFPSAKPSRSTPSPTPGLGELPSLRVQTQQSPVIRGASPAVSDLSFRGPPEDTTANQLVSPPSTGSFHSRDVAGNTGFGNSMSLNAAAAQLPHETQQSKPFEHPPRTASFERPSRRQTPQPTPDNGVKLNEDEHEPEKTADRTSPFLPLSDASKTITSGGDIQPELAAKTLEPRFENANDGAEASPKLLSEKDRRDTWERDGESVYSRHSNVSIDKIRHVDTGLVLNSTSVIGRKSVSPHRLEHKGSSSAHSLASRGRVESGFDSRAGTPPVEPIKSSTPKLQGYEAGDAEKQPGSRTGTPANLAQKDDVSTRGAPPVHDADEDESPNASGGASLTAHVHDQATLHPTRGFPSVPPLRTPSPHELRNTILAPEPIGQNITPTEPLQPRKGTESPGEFEPPPIRRNSTFNTATSSPLKESDVLSDEILRTLSPSGAIPSGLSLRQDAQLLPPRSVPDQSVAKESSYTLKDYDNYWEDATDKPQGGEETETSAPRSVSPHTPSNLGNVAPISQAADGPKIKPVASRTSTGLDEVISPQQSQSRRRFSWEAPDEAAITAPRNEPTDQSPAEGRATPTLRIEAAPEDPAAVPLPASGNESGSLSSRSQTPLTQHSMQGTGAPAIPQGQEASIREAPSPLSASVVSEGGLTTAREQAQTSPAEENVPAQQISTSLVTPTPPAEHQPTLYSPVSATSPGSQLAAAKVMSFRDILALGSTTERINMFNETRRVFASQESGLDNWLSSLSAQHPELGFNVPVAYGTTTQLSAQAGTAPLPSVSQPSAQQPYYQQYLNASSPNPTPSSTSRSRLGGLSIPAQMSGSAFGHSGTQIGTKSKEFMHSAGKMGKGLLSKGKSKLRGSGDKGESTPHPAHPNPNKGERRTSWRLSLEPKSQEGSSAPHPDEEIDLYRPTPPPQLPVQSPLSPLDAETGTGTAVPWALPHQAPDSEHPVPKQHEDKEDVPDPLPISREFTSGATGAKYQDDSLMQIQDSGNIKDESTPDDWVMISHQSDNDHPQRMIASDAVLPSQKAPVTAGPEDSGIGLQSQQLNPSLQDNSETPQRASSFIGLPPIRRGSTFGITSKARKAAERFSLDDSDEVLLENEADAEVPLSPLSVDTPAPLDENQVKGPLTENEKLGAPAGQNNESKTVVQGGPQHNQQIQESQGDARDAQDRNLNRQNMEHRVLPYLQSLPPTMANPVQRLLPAGPWILEESHLSEPLHAVTKKRSGSDFAQQAMFHSYDKELGLEFPAAPAAPTPPVPQIPPRQRSDVPPSSAQRYPGLFAPRPGPWPRGQSPQQPQSQQDTTGNEATGGNPLEERGRKKRGTTVLKELGNRIARVTSRERRSSMNDSRPPSANIRGEELSETGSAVGDNPERKKKRSSFLSDMAAIGTPPESMRSTSGPAQQNSTPGRITRSFTAGGILDSGSGFANEDKEVPQKRRVSGIAGLFARSRQELNVTNSSTPSASGYDSQGSDRVDQNRPADIRSPARAGTMDTFVTARQDMRNDDTVGRQSRQASASGFVTSVFGRRSSSRTRDQPPVSPIKPQQPQQPPQQYQLPQPQFGPPIPHPGDYSHDGPVQSPPAVPLDVMQKSTTSLGSTPSSPVVVRQASQPLSAQPRPSPLGQEFPTTHNIPRIETDLQGSPQRSPALGDRRQSEADHFETPPEHRPESAIATPRIQDLAFERKLEGLQKNQTQEDVTAEAELLRPFTVSPDISVLSEVKVEERRLPQIRQAVPEETEDKKEEDISSSPATEKLTEESRAASSHALSPQPFSPKPSSPERQKIESPQLEMIKRQQTEVTATPPSTEASPQIARSVASERPSVPTSLESPLVASRLQGDLSPASLMPAQGQRIPNTVNQQQYPAQRPIPSSPMHPGQPTYQMPMNASSSPTVLAPGYNPNMLQTMQHFAPSRPGPPSLQPSVSSGQHESQGSRWKGLKSRMTDLAQMSQQQDQNRPAKGEKTKGSKLFGALRRSAKQSEPLNAQFVQNQWQQPQFRGHQQMHPPPTNPQLVGPHPQSPLSPLNAPRAQTMVQLQQQPGGNMPPRSQGPPVFYQTEPQYAPVPIPRGYSAVHGEGVLVPSSYQIRPHAPHSHTSPQLYHGPQQWQEQYQRVASGPLQQQRLLTPQDTLRSQSTGVSSSGQPSLIGGTPDASPGPQQTKALSTESPSGQSSRHNLLINQGNRPEPQQQGESDEQGLGIAAAASQSPQQKTPEFNGKRGIIASSGAPSVDLRSTSQSPDMSPQDSAGQSKYMSSLSLDILGAQQTGEQSLHDAVFSVKGNETEGNGKNVEISRATSAERAGDVTSEGGAKDMPPAELEDTEEARKRAIRLASQEEKIAIDPEDFEPKMSATSYPGQEWNPFGIPEFGDWKED